MMFYSILTYYCNFLRKNGSPNLTYGDFIVVQSVWGITQENYDMIKKIRHQLKAFYVKILFYLAP